MKNKEDFIMTVSSTRIIGGITGAVAGTIAGLMTGAAQTSIYDPSEDRKFYCYLLGGMVLGTAVGVTAGDIYKVASNKLKTMNTDGFMGATSGALIGVAYSMYHAAEKMYADGVHTGIELGSMMLAPRRKYYIADHLPSHHSFLLATMFKGMVIGGLVGFTCAAVRNHFQRKESDKKS